MGIFFAKAVEAIKQISKRIDRFFIFKINFDKDKRYAKFQWKIIVKKMLNNWNEAGRKPIVIFLGAYPGQRQAGSGVWRYTVGAATPLCDIPFVYKLHRMMPDSELSSPSNC